MFGWALLFFLLALLSGGLGFFLTTGAIANLAQVLFFIFVVLLMLIERYVASHR